MQEDWVLCRVFHKSRLDNGVKLSPQFDMFETTPNHSLALPSSSPTNHTLPPGFTSFSSIMPTHHNHQNTAATTTNSLMNLLQFSRETNTNNDSTVTHQDIPKGDQDHGYDDDDGFLWNMDLQENSFPNDDVASNLDVMRFEDHDSMVFL